MGRIHYQLKKRLYRLKAFRRKGFGIHSPYVFHLVTNVIEAKLNYYVFGKLLPYRKKAFEYLKSDMLTKSVKKEEESKIKREYSFIKSSESLDRLLFRLMNSWKPKEALYVGDTVGFSLAYMCKLDSRKSISWLGRSDFFRTASARLLNQEFGIENYHDVSIEKALNDSIKYDLVLVAPESNKTSLIQFIDNCQQILSDDCMLIVQNPHENEGVNFLWNKLKNSDKFTVSLDLFYMGILISREGMQKQNYVRKYRF